jgi:hypothetical protein
MLGVVDLHAGHNGAGAENGRYIIIRWEAVEPEFARADHLDKHVRWDLLEPERIVNTAHTFLYSADAVLDFWDVLAVGHRIEVDLQVGQISL